MMTARVSSHPTAHCDVCRQPVPVVSLRVFDNGELLCAGCAFYRQSPWLLRANRIDAEGLVPFRVPKGVFVID